MGKIRVLYICTDFNVLAGSSLSLLNLINGVKDYVTPVVLFAWKGKVSDEYEKRGIECIFCPFFYLSTKRKRIGDLLTNPKQVRLYSYLAADYHCVKYVCEYLKDNPVDMVHSNASISTIGYYIAKKLEVPHVWHIREFLDLDFGINAYGGRRRLRRLINKANSRICVSESVCKHWNFINDCTYIVPDAVRSESDLKYIKRKENYFLFCSAAITELKGASVAVEAFCKSGVANRGYVLRLIGGCDDSYKSVLLQLAKNYNAEDSIIFEGYCNDVSTQFEKATAFLMCSQNEAMGRVTIEAMFYGCLVIGNNSGGTSEIIQHNKTGFLYNTMNECADLISRIIDIDYGNIIENSQEMVREKYTEEVYGISIKNIYKELIDARRRC